MSQGFLFLRKAVAALMATTTYLLITKIAGNFAKGQRSQYGDAADPLMRHAARSTYKPEQLRAALA